MHHPLSFHPQDTQYSFLRRQADRNYTHRRDLKRENVTGTVRIKPGVGNFVDNLHTEQSELAERQYDSQLDGPLALDVELQEPVIS